MMTPAIPRRAAVLMGLVGAYLAAAQPSISADGDTITVDASKFLIQGT